MLLVSAQSLRHKYGVVKIQKFVNVLKLFSPIVAKNNKVSICTAKVQS